MAVMGSCMYVYLVVLGNLHHQPSIVAAWITSNICTYQFVFHTFMHTIFAGLLETLTTECIISFYH